MHRSGFLGLLKARFRHCKLDFKECDTLKNLIIKSSTLNISSNNSNLLKTGEKWRPFVCRIATFFSLSLFFSNNKLCI